MRGAIFRHLSPSQELAALALAIAGGLIAAIVVMFVPAALLEAAVARTGVSEFLSAAQPPLGATARAMIAFATGIVAMMAGAAAVGVFSVVKGRRSARAEHYAAEIEAALPDETEPDAQRTGLNWLRTLTRRARANGSDAIYDLSDVPKLRAADRHPDAPARRPIIASSDLGEPLVAAEPVTAAPIEAQPYQIAPALDQPAPDDLASEPSTSAVMSAEHLIAEMVSRPDKPSELDPDETLAQMLARLEASINRGSAAHTGRPAKIAVPGAPRPMIKSEPGSADALGQLPMDDALRSALKSLGRMSAVR